MREVQLGLTGTQQDHFTSQGMKTMAGRREDRLAQGLAISLSSSCSGYSHFLHCQEPPCALNQNLHFVWIISTTTKNEAEHGQLCYTRSNPGGWNEHNPTNVSSSTTRVMDVYWGPVQSSRRSYGSVGRRGWGIPSLSFFFACPAFLGLEWMSVMCALPYRDMKPSCATL